MTTPASRRAGLRTVSISIALAALIAALLPSNSAVAGGGLNVQLVQSGFSQPVFMTHAGDGRLFVVEQGGDIEIVGKGTFLDITDRISSGGERGLLGLAFHPNYRSNGLFYVFYTRA